MIDKWGIRARVLLVAVLPMMVVATVLTGFYTSTRISDLEAAHADRGKAFARQLVAASEYAVFSGNHQALQQLATATLAEEGVIAVTVLGRGGEPLAHAGLERPHGATAKASAPLGLHSSQSGSHVQRIIEPIVPSRVDLDDGLTSTDFDADTGHPLLGHVLLEFSLDALYEKRAQLLRTGTLAILAVLFGAVLLAWTTSQGVSGPVRRVAAAVERIGQGRFSERVPVVGGGSLRSLAEGVNHMARQLAEMHDDMSMRIEAATAALRAGKEEAERANLAKSRFLAAASHDLRQPMHALGLFIAELSQQHLDRRSTHLLHQVAASAEAVENLLDSLLDISRLDAGVLEINARPFEIGPLLKRVVATLRPAARDRGVDLRERMTDAWVASDPLLFERIVSNLISNAIRYAPGGRVFVTCRRRGEAIRIEVRDNGIGIPVDAQAIIFQEFVQLGNPERNRDKGLGLGLAIVRRLCDLLNHRLTLRSAPGRGSVFAVELPCCPARARSAPAEQVRTLGDLAGFRIALIDDDPLALSAMTSLLHSWGCVVLSASNVSTLLEQFGKTPPPQLLISDYRLSDKESGITAVARVREWFDYPLSAALMSGDTDADTQDSAQRAGLPLLHKPVRPARLRALINRVTAQFE